MLVIAVLVVTVEVVPTVIVMMITVMVVNMILKNFHMITVIKLKYAPSRVITNIAEM